MQREREISPLPIPTTKELSSSLAKYSVLVNMGHLRVSSTSDGGFVPERGRLEARS